MKTAEPNWNVVKCERKENKEIEELKSSLQKTAPKIENNSDDLLSLMDSLK